MSGQKHSDDMNAGAPRLEERKADDGSESANSVIEVGPSRPPADESQAGPQTSDRVPRLFGLLVIVFAFGIVGGWGAVAPIDGAVVAPGTVTVDSYRKTVAHLEGGIVESIHVADGDQVEPGELLFTLDETQARAAYLVTYNRLIAERAREARLQAELDQAEAIDFPDRLLERAEANPRAERALRNEQREFLTRRQALEGEISVLRQRIEQLGERVNGLRSQREARLRAMDSLEDEIGSLERLAERELVARSDRRPLERQLADAQGEAGELLASIAQTRIESGEAELQILQRRREFEREVAAQLRETSSNVDSLEEELRALEDTLSRKQIRSPVSGVVVNLQVHSERAVIQGGQPLLDVVPGDDMLVLEGRVRPQDIDSVNVGQETDVRFTAFSFRTTPVVEGVVTFVSADSLQDDVTGDYYYLVRVKVSDDAMAALGDVYLRPGMPADLMIKTGERTPLEYLMKPLTDALARSWTED